MTSPTILVVEDNPITRKMVRVALTSADYRVLEAPDGQTALDLMAREAPNLILQDLLLPDMDGLELLARLRALPGGAGVPILAISGFTPDLGQPRGAPVAFTDYLFKPVEPSHLLLTVASYLRPAAGAGEKPGRGRRLLVVDDDPVQLKLLQVQMEQLGFQVATAGDGRDALEQARAARPEAIISDVLMPHLDGFRLCLALRQEASLAAVPVVLTSAVYTEEADQQLARTVGANAFVLRTPDSREAIQAVLAALDSGARPGSDHPPQLPLEEYTHRVIRQLEHQVSLSVNFTRRLALLEAELGILARLMETLQSTSAADTVLREMLHRCLDAAGISRGAAYLLDDEGRLRMRARLGPAGATDAQPGEEPAHGALLRQVLERGEPIELRSADEPTGPAGARSMLLAPLMLGEEQLGVLEMVSASRELGGDWISFARAMGSQISQALQLARTLARLKDAEERYRDLIEGLDAIIWEANPATGRFTFVSRQAQKCLGYPLQRWLAEPDFLSQLLHPADSKRTLEQLNRVAAEARNAVLEFRLVSADERVLWFQNNVHVVRDAEGRTQYLRGIMVDITERVRLKEQETKLRLARELHQRLFPERPPALAGFDLAGASHSAEATGGDYFDFLPLPDGSLGVVIADASGHGFGPALLMAETRAYLRALTQTHSDLSEVLALLNKTLTQETGDGHFVTLVLARLDATGHTLRYASAGHVSGYVLDGRGIVKASLPSTAMPLGIEPEVSFPSGDPVTLEAGDLVLLLTDGILEETAPDQTPFGSGRALDVVRAYRRGSATEIIANLYAAVRAFSQNFPQVDDITAVVIKVQSEPEA